MLSTSGAPDLDERLLAYAARDPDGAVLDAGNELLRFLSAAPDHAVELLRHHFDLWLSSGLGPRLTELVRLAVAEQTRCPVCLAIRRPGAVRAGVDEALVRALGDPAHPGFDAREVAAVDYATTLAGDHAAVTPATYAALRDLFDAEEVAELAMLTVSFLGLGRLLETLMREQDCPLPS